MVAGFLARHAETGRIYLFHTGRVGGGAKGVSREAFLAWSGLEPTTVIDSPGQAREAILIMPVEGAGATRSLVSYIQQVIDFKQAVRAGDPPTPEIKARAKLLKDYFREASGRRRGKRRATVSAGVKPTLNDGARLSESLKNKGTAQAPLSSMTSIRTADRAR